MKKTLPLFLLVVCLLGCSKFGPDAASISNSNSANSNAAPAKPVQVVNLPAMVGKSRDEIKKMVSATPKNENPWLEYDLPEAYVTIQFTKEKPSSLSFRFKSRAFGEASISGTGTADQLGTMAGIDVSGKTPRNTSQSFDNYDYEIDGKKVEVTFEKLSNTYNAVSIHLR
jgi:hypothetical protein